MPFCRMDEFVPTRLGPLIQKDLQPGSISVTFVDPDGKPQDIRIGYWQVEMHADCRLIPLSSVECQVNCAAALSSGPRRSQGHKSYHRANYRFEYRSHTWKMLVSAPRRRSLLEQVGTLTWKSLCRVGLFT